MRRVERRYVRRMPKIYGNLQPRQRSFTGLFVFSKRVLLVLGVVAVLYGIFFSSFFKVEKVEIEGAELTSADQLRELVPTGGSIWFVPKDGIMQKTLEQPLVLSAQVMRGIPDTVRLVVEEKRPVLAWHTGEAVILVDADGYAFAQFTATTLPSIETAAGQRISSIPHVYDTKNLPVTLDERIVGTDFLTFVNKAQQEFAHHLPEILIDRIEIVDTTYDVTFIATQGLRVHMNSLADAGVQTRNLTRLIQQGKANVTSQVDLRIDRWAYVQ